MAGFAAILLRPDRDLELDGLFVDPPFQGRGIGRALVDHCAAYARERGAGSLHVTGNPHAEGFYRTAGFALTGTCHTRFGPGLLLRRQI
jgi:GNAT superfamily N-acetyltransferase